MSKQPTSKPPRPVSLREGAEKSSLPTSPIATHSPMQKPKKLGDTGVAIEMSSPTTNPRSSQQDLAQRSLSANAPPTTSRPRSTKDKERPPSIVVHKTVSPKLSPCEGSTSQSAAGSRSSQTLVEFNTRQNSRSTRANSQAGSGSTTARNSQPAGNARNSTSGGGRHSKRVSGGNKRASTAVVGDRRVSFSGFDKRNRAGICSKLQKILWKNKFTKTLTIFMSLLSISLIIAFVGPAVQYQNKLFAQGQSVVCPWFGAVSIDLLATENPWVFTAASHEGAELSIVSFTQPAKGRVEMREDGKGLIYRAPVNESYLGNQYFEYEVSDAKGRRTSAPVTVAVRQTYPKAIDDVFIIPDGKPFELDVLANDQDAKNEALFLAAGDRSGEFYGLFIGLSDRTVTYFFPDLAIDQDPPSQPSIFKYRATNGYAVSNEATAKLYIKKRSYGVSAVDDHVTVYWNSPTAIFVTDNDSNEREQALTLTVITRDGITISEDDGSVINTDQGSIDLASITGDLGPFFGKMADSVTDQSTKRPHVVYEPNQGFTGSDGFGYQVKNEKGFISRAFVYITVIASTPIARDDTCTPFVGSDPSRPSCNVITNDSDPVMQTSDLFISSITSVTVTGGNSGSPRPICRSDFSFNRTQIWFDPITTGSTIRGTPYGNVDIVYVVSNGAKTATATARFTIYQKDTLSFSTATYSVQWGQTNVPIPVLSTCYSSLFPQSNLSVVTTDGCVSRGQKWSDAILGGSKKDLKCETTQKNVLFGVPSSNFVGQVPLDITFTNSHPYRNEFSLATFTIDVQPTTPIALPDICNFGIPSNLGPSGAIMKCTVLENDSDFNKTILSIVDAKITPPDSTRNVYICESGSIICYQGNQAGSFVVTYTISNGYKTTFSTAQFNVNFVNPNGSPFSPSSTSDQSIASQS